MRQIKSGRSLWLTVSILAGALCAAVRRWQLSTAFENEPHLSRPFAPASIVLTALLILSAVVLLLLARRQPVARSLRQNPGGIADAGGDTLFMGAMTAAAFLSLAAAPLLFNRGRQLRQVFEASKHYGAVTGGNNGILTLIAAVSAILAFAGLLMAGRAAYRNTSGQMALLLPTVSNCLWLMALYRENAANPVRWDYSPLLLAVVCGILFYLDWTGLAADVPHPRRTLWLAGMTVVLSAAALAGNWDGGSALLLGSQLVSALAFLWRVPENLIHPPEPAAEPAQAEEKLEEDTHE